MGDIFFRVDGNSSIATGHIMRCLTIARACQQFITKYTMAKRLHFVVSDSESENLLKDKMSGSDSFIIHNLHTDYRRPEEELKALLRATEKIISVRQTTTDSIRDTSSNRCNCLTADKCWIFVDSYYATPAYFEMLSQHFKVAYLDDLRSFPCAVDLVINYDTASSCSYYEQAAECLLGAQFTPLREQFEAPAYKVKASVTDILLSTGGTDPYRIAEQLLPVLLSQNTSSHYHLITSRMNKRLDVLYELSRQNPRLHVHEGVTDMASLMAGCDLAVSAGGTTLCELAAVGVPTISYSMADNQLTAVCTFEKQGLIPYAGDIRTDNAGDVLYRVAEFMTRMSQDYEARKKSSQLLRAFIDGMGAKKIARKLLEGSLPLHSCADS